MFTAVASYLQAKSHQGQWLLRIDDIDSPRVALGASDGIKRTLERYALYWDEAVVLQSGRTEAYETALERLDTNGWLYPCSCSRKTLATLPKSLPNVLSIQAFAATPALPQSQPCLAGASSNAIINAEDKLQGQQSWDIEREVGDFIVLRRDRIVSYHLATVIDDWSSGVTEVLVGSTF